MLNDEEAAFLRDLAARIFRHAAPAQGFDQGDVDQLYALAARRSSTTMPTPVSDDSLREALDAGLRSFCSVTEDFTMSSAMRRSAADHILAQPGLFAALKPDTTPLTDTQDRGE
jgi:hypothetical protein